MTWAMGHPKQAQQPGGRFIPPETPVSKRIDQLTSHCTGQERQAQWLKQTLESRWSRELPPPYRPGQG